MVCFSPDGQPLSKSALKKLEKEKEKAKKKAEKQAKLVRTPPPPPPPPQNQVSVVRRLDSAIHLIVIFLTIVKMLERW